MPAIVQEQVTDAVLKGIIQQDNILARVEAVDEEGHNYCDDIRCGDLDSLIQKPLNLDDFSNRIYYVAACAMKAREAFL